jgi:hypothetical protein
MNENSGFVGIVTDTVTKYCQACGEPCGGNWINGYSSMTISQVKDGKTEELAYLCMKCFAAGILHAANQARAAACCEVHHSQQVHHDQLIDVTTP